MPHDATRQESPALQTGEEVNSASRSARRSCGTTLNRSPTTPKSARSKIGASASLLTATIVFDVCMPARCWIAPEMPSAMYSCGETDLPVCPTWNWCG